MVAKLRFSFLCAVVAVVPLAHSQLNHATYKAPPSTGFAVIILNRRGVYPTSIDRPKGPFLLFIENHMAQREEHFSLTLDQPGAAELVGLDTHANQAVASSFVDLLPGLYRLQLKRSSQISVAINIRIGK